MGTTVHRIKGMTCGHCVSSEQVAELYRLLAPRTRAVANKIADANGVHPTQVHRWVRVARQKGYLSASPGRGRVG